MPVSFKENGPVIVALMFIAVGSMTYRASAITVDVAKKCQTLTAKAFPPREVGNPAAGSAKGSAQEERDYFSRCIANNGNVEEKTPEDSK
jgi:hypothetical protein